jgi:hypothetical protein
MPEKFAPRFMEIDRLIRTPPGTPISRLEGWKKHFYQIAKNGE